MNYFVYSLIAVCLLFLRAFPQNAYPEKISELRTATDGDVNLVVETLRDVSLKEFPKSKIYIINYGTSAMISSRSRELNKQFAMLNVDRTRIEFSRNVPYPILISEFWLIRDGEGIPKPTYQGELVDEFGLISEKTWKSKLDSIRNLYPYCEDDIFLVIDGPKRIADSLTKQFWNYLARRECDSPDRRISIMFRETKTKTKTKTHVWIIRSNRKE